MFRYFIKSWEGILVRFCEVIPQATGFIRKIGLQS